MQPIQLHIQLDTLIRHRQTGNGDPYLWVIFFKADDTCVKITDQFRLQGKPYFQFSKTGHSTLGRNLSQKRIAIPEAMGSWQTELVPLWLPHFEQPTVGVAGVVYVVLDHYNLSQQGAIAAHNVLNTHLERAANRAIQNFTPQQIQVFQFTDTLKDYFAAAFKTELAGIQDAVVEAVKGSQSLFANLWTLLHTDSLIGYDFKIITQFDFEDDPQRRVEFGERWTTDKSDWELQGHAELVR
jgi:hypothetical protein